MNYDTIKASSEMEIALEEAVGGSYIDAMIFYQTVMLSNSCTDCGFDSVCSIIQIFRSSVSNSNTVEIIVGVNTSRFYSGECYSKLDFFRQVYKKTENGRWTLSELKHINFSKHDEIGSNKLLWNRYKYNT